MKQYQTTTLSFSGDLESAVERAYEFMLSENSDYPYIINCRNFIPNILEFENGVQRYSIFNSVRKKLFSKYNVSNYPTACALGSTNQFYTLSYTRAKTPAQFFENPDQVSAFEYPEKYGNPLFSRAGYHEDNILISGTASIKNSETMFIGDIKAQTLLTIQNMVTLNSSPLNDDLKYYIYVKNKEDNDVVESICKANNIVGDIINVDICRDDLLVEIEAYSKGLNI